MSLGGLVVVLGLPALVLAAFSQESGGGGVRETAKMIPQGFVSHQVVIPSFKDGRLGSRMTAETLIRLDDERFEAGRTRIEIFAELPAQNVLIEMPSAVYQMAENVLRSGERSRVTRTDFEVEGDTLVFDTNSSIGAMKGRVRTLIFDMEAAKGESKNAKTSSD